MRPCVVEWERLGSVERAKLLVRPAEGANNPELSGRVRTIIEMVRAGGDGALSRLTLELDRVSVESFRVSSWEIRNAYEELPLEVIRALEEAIGRIAAFHEAQVPASIRVETFPGVRCERRFLPIERVGLYVPGGTAPLPSTVLMLGIPSRIAGCPRRVLVTPPRGDGSVDPAILVAADLVGISEIFRLGGAQAIAALAYGTESVPKVDKIFGPGNAWVTEAKLQVSRDPAGASCDLPAGPSEMMVIADERANPRFVAADLLSQAEHGADSQVLLATDSDSLLEAVLSELSLQLEQLPRKAIAAQALSHSLLIRVPSVQAAVGICNDYAPEHLILQVEEPRALSRLVRNAGSIFLGPWTPESMGDYASGTNHVLPTYGFARSQGGLATESFMKGITLQELTRQGLKDLGPTVECLARIEGLEAHRKAVSLRLRGT